MTTLLAVMDFQTLAVGGAIGAAISLLAGNTFSSTPEANIRQLENEMRELQRKLDALLKHQGIEMPPRPSGLSPGVERLARDPGSKIAAIKLYRGENPGIGLREAKEKIEEFYNRGR